MIKNIIFDFDGVILDSVPVKTEAFRVLFDHYDKNMVDTFIDYHLLNGGMSRYLKIRYFFEQLLGQDISEKNIIQLAEEYSELTKRELAQQQYIIQDTITFIKQNYQTCRMHIASGAAEDDLNFICDTLDLTQYFFSIHGSPQSKDKLVKEIIESNQYIKDETILIGDSINDLDAANINNIVFYGYNNSTLARYNYIDTFMDFDK
jgi:phosphoglycolate phosphatase-like HAD superfamily hydrolase